MDKIVKIIMRKIEDFNETLDDSIDLSKGSESIIFGQGSGLESIDFVSLIIDIEQAVNDEFGSSVSLVDAHAMSQQHSPFRTVGSLAEYIQEQIGDADHE